jgi:hypothetical protein
VAAHGSKNRQCTWQFKLGSVLTVLTVVDAIEALVESNRWSCDHKIVAVFLEQFFLTF